MPGSLGGMIAGLGPSKKPEQLYLQIPPRASPSAPARLGRTRGAAGSLLHLGILSVERQTPQGPLANAVEIVKKRVTRQFNCCTPRLPLAHGNYLTGSSPQPP